MVLHVLPVSVVLYKLPLHNIYQIAAFAGCALISRNDAPVIGGLKDCQCNPSSKDLQTPTPEPPVKIIFVSTGLSANGKTLPIPLPAPVIPEKDALLSKGPRAFHDPGRKRHFGFAHLRKRKT